METCTVGELTLYLKHLLEGNELLQDVWVEGEVSNYIRASSGHCYFDLIEGGTVLRCVMWRSHAMRWSRLLGNGASVVVHGGITIYPQKGQYQAVVDLVQPQGVGILRLRLEQLRQKLEEEGLFDESRKRELPAFPKRIGIVTSETGAVLRDIATIVERRYPLVELILAHTQVEGESAPASIVQAIGALNLLHQYREDKQLDLIIVARGGGSMEDLAAFNDEQVVRAVYASRMPVISAVGHETDTTLIDLVADLRAPTPSAAAELAVPDMRDLRAQLNDWSQRLAAAAEAEMEGKREDVAAQMSALQRVSPQVKVEQYRQRIDDLLAGVAVQLRHRLRLDRERLASRTLQLQSLDPKAVLSRGYSIVRFSGDGPIVSSAEQVSTGDALDVQTAHGRYEVVVMYSDEE